MAPEVGFEPTTNRLTADRSTAELLRITEGEGRLAKAQTASLSRRWRLPGKPPCQVPFDPVVANTETFVAGLSRAASALLLAELCALPRVRILRGFVRELALFIEDSSCL